MVIFFFGQSEKLEAWHQTECASQSYTIEEQAAGFPGVAEKFGFLATLHNLTEGDMEKEDFVLSQPVFRVYRKIQLNSHFQAARTRHQQNLRRKR